MSMDHYTQYFIAPMTHIPWQKLRGSNKKVSRYMITPYWPEGLHVSDISSVIICVRRSIKRNMVLSVDHYFHFFPVTFNLGPFLNFEMKSSLIITKTLDSFSHIKREYCRNDTNLRIAY